MDLENPSYFSVPTEDPFLSGSHRDSSGSTSDSSLTRQLTPPRARGRDFRHFVRSVSTNSADSNQELLIMGQPRLSDMAPDLAFKHPTSRSNSLKKDNGVVYRPLPTREEEDEDDLSNDEVFFGEDTAKYYNFAAMKRNSSGRRHSISTFMGRERTASVASSSRSFKEDLPQVLIHQNAEGDANAAMAIDDHSLRHMSYPRKRCNKCTKGNISKVHANMDDILIVSLKGSEAASLWVDYFSNYFLQISKQAHRKPFKIQHLGLEELTNGDSQHKELQTKTSGVKLQLVVVCPGFLEFISEHPIESCAVGKILLADRTLALLLGVTDSDLNDAHKNALPTYYQWQRQCVGQDQDETFTKEFLGQAMAILSKIWKQQSSVIAQEKSCFSVTPKKIRQGQNSVFILLTHPLQKEDIVKISVERNGELHEVKSVKKRNPYIVKITVPENLTEVTAIVNVLVEKNGSIIGSRPIKCESKLRELEQILKSANNPIDFMCQTLGFAPADKDHLDSWLVQGLQRNLPPHFNLLANHGTPFAATVQVHKHSHEEFPTLLHFATKFGLEKLAVQLLDCPGADVAYEVRNIYDMTPVEMAEANGHSQLASVLRGYMNMNEVSSMYAKLKEMSLAAKTPEIDEEGYLAPKNIGELYKLCPAPRPVTPSNSPVTTPSSECSGTPLGYMAMSTPRSKPTTSKCDTKKEEDKDTTIVPEDKVQKELVEIINDFKNNVHSISQVEKLVEEWKKRNDVQMSFKEKQQQLLEMRTRYEKIQQEMKNAMKKPTPFDRIRKLFTRGKHEKNDTPMNGQSILGVAQGQRPISSLSTSSSGSSGRMSTISGCSLGDSGTHSDNEERKLMLGSNHNEDEFRNELNKAILELNYTPVPAPKPLRSFGNKQTFETIEEKPLIRPDNLPLADDFYIKFPPSNMPVAGYSDEDRKTTAASNEYMNVSANVQLDGHEYMNFKATS